MGTSTCYCNFQIDFEKKKKTQNKTKNQNQTLTALEGKSTDALFVLRGLPGQWGCIERSRLLEKQKPKKPKTENKQTNKKQNQKSLGKKVLLALAASHSIWVHHLPVNPWLRRYESDIALRKSFL